MSGTPSRFRIGEKAVDLVDRVCDGQELTDQDCGLLLALVERRGDVVSKADLYREVWGYRSVPQGRALDFAIRRLREKIELDPKKPQHLEIVRGRGFRLTWQPQAVEQRAPISFDKPPVRSRWTGVRDPIVRMREEIERSPALFTVLGPAGVGKTRHLLEACADRSVIWIRMHDVTDAWDFVGVICQALSVTGVPLSGDMDALVPQLGASLSSRSSLPLLVLDGAESMVDTLREVLPPLLSAVPNLRWLVTSRVRLELMEENVFEVSPLDEVAALDFMQSKADAVTGSGRHTRESLAPLAALLDGLPLAMELAAPRLRALKPDALLERLRRDVHILRDAPGLPVSLPQILKESIQHLEPGHLRALEVLSLLSRGVTFETAEALLADYGDPLDLVSYLVDQSLLLKIEVPEQSDRFRVTWALASTLQSNMDDETVTQGWERLAHYASRWYREDGQGAVSNLEEKTLRSRLREEFVHAEKWIEALVRCSQERHAVELTRAFAMLLRWEGDRRRAIRLLEDLSGRVRSVTGRAALIGFAVELAAESRDVEKADTLLAQHEELCAGTAQLAMASFSVRAVVLRHKGKPTDAVDAYRQAIDVVSESTSDRDRAWLIQGQCFNLSVANRVDESLVLVKELKTLVEGNSYGMLQIRCLIFEAFFLFRDGDVEGAAFGYRKASRLALHLGHSEEFATLRRKLALALRTLGDAVGAHRARADVFNLLDSEQHANVYAPLLMDEALYVQSLGDQEQAIRLAEQALRLCRDRVSPARTLTVLHNVCSVGLWAERAFPFHDALDWFDELCREQDMPYYSASVRVVKGILAVREGQQQRALALLNEGWEYGKGCIGQPEALYLLGRLAALSFDVGQAERAREFLTLADETFGDAPSWRRVMDNNPWYVRVRRQLAELEI